MAFSPWRVRSLHRCIHLKCFHGFDFNFIFLTLFRPSLHSLCVCVCDLSIWLFILAFSIKRINNKLRIQHAEKFACTFFFVNLKQIFLLNFTINLNYIKSVYKSTVSYVCGPRVVCVCEWNVQKQNTKCKKVMHCTYTTVLTTHNSWIKPIHFVCHISRVEK